MLKIKLTTWISVSTTLSALCIAMITTLGLRDMGMTIDECGFIAIVVVYIVIALLLIQLLDYDPWDYARGDN